jgi:hypothetical protein
MTAQHEALRYVLRVCSWEIKRATVLSAADVLRVPGVRLGRKNAVHNLASVILNDSLCHG